MREKKILLTLFIYILTSVNSFSIEPDVFIEGPPGLVFSRPTVTVNNFGKKLLMDISVEGIESLDDSKGQTLENRQFVVTLVDGTRAVEKVLRARQRTPSEPLTSITKSTSSVTLAKILLISLIESFLRLHFKVFLLL